jgi:hypothetical protein
MMKITAVAAFALVAGNARADLGDTVTTAQQKYGEPQKGLFEHEVDYVHNNCRIEQYYNNVGVCVAVNYFRLDGKPFSKAVNAHLDADNLPSWTLNANGNGWSTIPWTDDTATRNTVEYRWTNGSSTFQVINGQSLRDGVWYCNRMYVLPEGIAVMKADTVNYQQAHAAPTPAPSPSV